MFYQAVYEIFCILSENEVIVKSVAIINSEFITDKLIDVTLKYSFALTPFPSLGMDQEQFQSMYLIFFPAKTEQ